MRRIVTSLATLASLALAQSTSEQTCLFPAPSSNFTRHAYSGEWYEIAKFQTAGGAYFEKDCVCTQLNVTFGGTPDEYYADNICRYKTPDGAITNAKGTLFDEGPSGHFQQNFFPLTPAVDYTILLLGELDGEEFSVEYDCGSTYLTGLNYCVHFLSRKPTMSPHVLDHLIAEVNKRGLNFLNLPLQMTKQEGCWNKQAPLFMQ